MIWLIVISRSRICWLYGASPFWALKNIINLIFSINHLVMSIIRIISWVVGKGCLLWPACSLDKTLLFFALFHFVFQGQVCLLFWVFLEFLLLHSNPLWWKGHLFSLLVLEGAAGLYRNGQLQLLWHPWLVHAWITMMLNRLPWKQTGIILLLLRLYPSTAFWTHLLTVSATPVLLRDSCPQ